MIYTLKKLMFKEMLSATILVGLASLFLTGCGDNHAKWDAERIKSEMEKHTNMDIVVTERDGSLTAEGIGRKDRKYTFTIQQDAKKRSITWTSFDESGKKLKTHTSWRP
jgi:hypothetical protein